jgi:acetyl-CoA carboxylase biotin carboxyl carrier protein
VFKVQELREIIKLVDASSIEEFVYENDGAKIKLKKSNGVVTEVVAPKKETVVQVVQPAAQTEVQPSPQPVQVAAAVIEETPKSTSSNDESLHKITSPMVGTFYQSPSPDAPPYVKVGDKVSDEKIVCIVEAMKLFNEIEAEIKGEIVEVLVKDGQLVEYGQPLFLVKPE